MEFDPGSTDRLPFHDPDEAEQGHAGATEPSRDAQRRHLQRVPLFSGFNEDELRRVAELSRIIEAPVGTVITQIGDAGDSFFVIIDGMAAVRTPVGAGSQLQPGDFFWRDEPGRWGASISDDRGDDRSPAAHRRSLPFLATAG
jgi:hypothetical protein